MFYVYAGSFTMIRTKGTLHNMSTPEVTNCLLLGINHHAPEANGQKAMSLGNQGLEYLPTVYQE